MDVAQENVLALNLGHTGAWPRTNQSIVPFQAVLVFVLFTLTQVSNLILVGPVWSQSVKWEAFCACVVCAGTQSLSLKCRRILTKRILVFFFSHPRHRFCLKRTDGQGSVSAQSHAVRAQICSQWKITPNQINSYGMVCLVLVQFKNSMQCYLSCGAWFSYGWPTNQYYSFFFKYVK